MDKEGMSDQSTDGNVTAFRPMMRDEIGLFICHLSEVYAEAKRLNWRKDDMVVRMNTVALLALIAEEIEKDMM